MGNFFQSKTLRIASVTMVSCFTLATTFTACVAWFSSKRAHDEGVDELVIKDYKEMFKSFKLYPLINPTDGNDNPLPISADSTEYTFSSTPSGTITYDYETKTNTTTGNVNLDLGVYSLMDQDHPLLGIFEINPIYASATETDPIKLSASTTHNFVGSYTLDNNGNPIYEEKLTKTSNPLSSIIRMQSFPLTSLSELDPDEQDTFTVTKSRLTQAQQAYSSQSRQESFVAFNESFTEVTFNKNITLFKTNSETVNYIGVIFNYYSNALEYIYAVYLGDEVISGEIGETDNSLPFHCDFTFLM